MNARQAADVERWAREDKIKVDDSAWRAYCAELEDGKAAAKVGHVCQLCGAPAVVVDREGAPVVEVWDLCETCNSAFHFLAVGLELLEQTGPPRSKVAGQLELEEAEEGVYVYPAFEDRLGDILAAFRTGDWAAVDTMTIGDAVRHHADGFTRAELAEMRRVLGRRS